MDKTARVRLVSRLVINEEALLGGYVDRPAGLQLFFTYLQHTQFTVTSEAAAVDDTDRYRDHVPLISWLLCPGSDICSSRTFFNDWLVLSVEIERCNEWNKKEKIKYQTFQQNRI